MFTLHSRSTFEKQINTFHYTDTVWHTFSKKTFSLLFASVKHRFRRCKSDSDYNYVPYSYHPTLKDLEESARPKSTILTKAFFSIAHGLPHGPPRSMMKSLSHDQGSKSLMKSQDQGSRDGSKIREDKGEDKDDP